jgi:hypothetical protein
MVPTWRRHKNPSCYDVCKLFYLLLRNRVHLCDIIGRRLTYLPNFLRACLKASVLKRFKGAIIRDENGFGIPETVFEFFQSKLSASVFLGIGICNQNFRSESVQPFIDRFLRLPFWVGIYRIHNSIFTENINQSSSKFTAHGPVGSTAAAHHGRLCPISPPRSTGASAALPHQPFTRSAPVRQCTPQPSAATAVRPFPVRR